MPCHGYSGFAESPGRREGRLRRRGDLRVLKPDGSVTEKPAFAEFKRIALAQR